MSVEPAQERPLGATVLSAHETFTVHGCAASGLSPRQSSAVVQSLKCDKEPALLLASQFLKSDKELAKNAGCSSYKPVPKTRERTVPVHSTVVSTVVERFFILPTVLSTVLCSQPELQ